jgi:subtilase family serine protease
VQVITNSTLYGVEGTSLAAPVWSAIAAFINAARSANTIPLAAIGLLNPQLYGYAGDSLYRDVTTGNNGAYSAAAGYDLTTGLGTPINSTLVPILAGVAPQITLQPSSILAEATQATYFEISATGTPSPSYQWQRKAAGTSTWVNLTDTGQIYRGNLGHALRLQHRQLDERRPVPVRP